MLTRPSDLDLAVFFARHPLSLLSSESLSAFLGYPLKDIAESLETLLAAGVLRRRQTGVHAARYYELIVDGPAATVAWLEPLLTVARTREGRLALLKEISRRAHDDRGHPRSNDAPRPGPRRLADRDSKTNETKTG